MIVQFPVPYEDELAYSLFARFFARSGYLAYRFAAEDLFENKLTKPDIEFVDRLTPAAYHALERIGSWEDFVMRHTMFKYYSQFLPLQRRKAAYDAIMGHDRKYHDYLCMPKSNDCTTRYLRYCPICVTNDRNKYGETYWHRLHQMHGVNVCPIHFCFLENSNIAISSNGTPTLVSAEEIIPSYCIPSYCTNPLECKLAQYVADVFSAAFDPYIAVPFHKRLHAALERTKYVSPRGKQRNTAVMFTDYLQYYSDYPSTPLTQQWQMQKTFSGQRYNMLEICSIAMFLGIHPSELTHPVCYTAQNEQKPLQSHQRKKANRGNTRKKNWERIDAETLPLVKDLLSQLTTEPNAKPIRITLGLIQRRLGLPEKSLNKCPQCRQLIESHIVSQDEHRRRLLIWAMNMLTYENRPINITNLMKLTNMKKCSIVHHCNMLSSS